MTEITSRCTGRFEPVAGQLGVKLRDHCLDCARRASKRLDVPIFAGVAFEIECKFKLVPTT